MAFAIAGSALVVCDIVQRTLVAGSARLFPRSRHRILTAWIQAMRYLVLDLATATLGGGRVCPSPRIPSRPGILVLMNHQSLLDIPLVVRTVEGGFPRIVTRERYARGIPVISHMIRLYQYPLVDPSATAPKHVRDLREAALNGDTPLAVFPEGSRTRTGALGRWKRGGLRLILGARAWQVYVVVADGMWHVSHARDFLRKVPGVEIRMRSAGPFASPEPGGDLEAFIDHMREVMEAELATLREVAA